MSVHIYSPPPTDPNEAERERAVVDTGALQARDDAKLEAICKEACRKVRGTSSLLSVLYGDTQYVIAAYGFQAGAYSRKNSLSGHALAAGNEIFIIPDLSSDERFAENPWINGENARFRFYAASLVRPYGRLPIGVLSVLDEKMRTTFSEPERRIVISAAEDAAARIVQISQERNMSPVPSPPPRS
ncbi:GAF domain-containing protein [Sphingomonas sp. T9W2]|uniref:GAF domain-containing protein n=1 Tax=Sphingomonas sp. T9W2 TaxID=3143183 RepID=UPI0031F54438